MARGSLLTLQALTQVPGRQRGCRGGGGLRRVGVEDGAVRLVVDQVGNVAPLFVLGQSRRAGARLEVGVAAGRVAADGTLVPAVGAGLEGQRGHGGVELRYRCEGVGIRHTTKHHIQQEPALLKARCLRFSSVYC